MTREEIFVSILICTRNRADELLACLSRLVGQAAEFPDVEVVIIDNGSTDNTRAVVEGVSLESGYALRYAFEPVAGLSQARNRGRQEARGSVLAFIDDDVIVGKGWVALIRDHFFQKKSDCLGGKVSIELGGEMPLRFEKDMHWFFMASLFGNAERNLIYPEHPIGCNMMMTRAVFDEVGGFDTNLKLYGDEKDFFRRVSERNFSVYYDPHLKVHQYIPAERLTLDELRNKSVKWGEGAAMNWLLEGNSGMKRVFKIFEYFLRTVYIGIVLKFRRNFGEFYTYWYNRGYISTLIKRPQQTANG